MKKIELLSPAGSMEALKAAAAGGCDAVYLGLKSFSARAFAGNFSYEEFEEAVRFCHTRGIRVYVTINTMLFESEIERAIKDVDFLYHHDCDALLIQDFGLFHYVRTCYPDFEIHCSTQMHIHNLAGAKLMKEEGASRVVMARETPIELIRQACHAGIEIEVFAYGAICISYSGQCLMSAAAKNRSANRGMCAQCCRLKYFNADGSSFAQGDYLLSPKDLNVIDRLDELIEAGVSSLKIEGRMKRPEYVYLVTKTFREAIDSYYEGKSYFISEKRKQELLLMFNRGFSHGHLFHDSVSQRMSHKRPNHMGIEIGEVIRYQKGRVLVRLTAPLYQNDGLRILNTPEDTGLTAVKIEKNGKLVSEAGAGDEVWLECHSKPVPRHHQKLRKTSDRRLIEKIDEYIEAGRKNAVSMNFKAIENHPFELEIRDASGDHVTAVSDYIIQKAQNAPMEKSRIIKSLLKTGEEPYFVTDCEGVAENIFIPVGVLNETRRSAFAMLNDQRAVYHPLRTQAKPYAFSLSRNPENQNRILLISNDSNANGNVSEDVKVQNVMPVIHPAQNEKEFLHYKVLSQAGDLYMNLDGCIGGLNLNLANSYAIAWILSRKGIDSAVLSSEISNEQTLKLLDAFENRYGFRPFVYRLVYGKRTLMYIKDRFTNENEMDSFSDLHGNIFKVKYNKNEVEIIESKPFTASNPYCAASALIIDGKPADYKEVIEEAYEELHERI